MLLSLFIIQVCVFLLFSLLEKKAKAHCWPKPKRFVLYWFLVVLFGAIWFQVIIFSLQFLPTAVINLPNGVSTVLYAYLFYSFLNYWGHRLKHSNGFLWQYFHKLHHSPSQMETKLTFYRHPVEIIFNTIVILLPVWLLGLSVEMVCAMLLIEGALECFHHSNIHYDKFRYVDWLIQTPEMHLLHHEYGLHKYNYSPLALWDLLFFTYKRPSYLPEKLGFADSNKPFIYLFLKNK